MDFIEEAVTVAWLKTAVEFSGLPPEAERVSATGWA
jgi:hypothetical protein